VEGNYITNDTHKTQQHQHRLVHIVFARTSIYPSYDWKH
jgi:hypothetical protein